MPAGQAMKPMVCGKFWTPPSVVFVRSRYGFFVKGFLDFQDALQRVVYRLVWFFIGIYGVFLAVKLEQKPDLHKVITDGIVGIATHQNRFM
jgi:hypothetical protein